MVVCVLVPVADSVFLVFFDRGVLARVGPEHGGNAGAFLIADGQSNPPMDLETVPPLERKVDALRGRDGGEWINVVCQIDQITVTGSTRSCRERPSSIRG